MLFRSDTLGRPPGRADDPLRDGVKMGTTLVGSPDTVAKGIHQLLKNSQGGFGGVMFRAHEWATREQTLRSYELFARYVMPQFQHSNNNRTPSLDWAGEHADRFMPHYIGGIQKAIQDHEDEKTARAKAAAAE